MKKTLWLIAAALALAGLIYFLAPEPEQHHDFTPNPSSSSCPWETCDDGSCRPEC